jgi:hypothetical protein
VEGNTDYLWCGNINPIKQIIRSSIGIDICERPVGEDSLSGFDQAPMVVVRILMGTLQN